MSWGDDRFRLALPRSVIPPATQASFLISLCIQTDDRVSRGSNSSLSSCSSVSEQRGFFIGQEITEDAEMSSSSFT